MFLSKIEGSPSLEVVNLVLDKKSKGEDVLSLAIGDPSSNTPAEIVERAHAAMISGDVHYVPSWGTREVREAIRRKVSRVNHINAEIEETIFLTTKFSVYAALVAVSEGPFDVLVPDPGYFYSEPVIISGGNPIRYRLAEDYGLDISEIKGKATPKTKAIIVNSPSNPTGKVLRKGELSELYGFCLEKGIFIIADEAYEEITFEDSSSHFAVGSLEQNPEIVISIFSLSKSYSMTGWRAGYIVASRRLSSLINKFLENSITCLPPFIQSASAYALNNCDRYVNQFRGEYRAKRELVINEIAKITALEANKIEGAFYAFPRVRGNSNSVELCKKLLQEENVAVLPGVAFGPAGEGRIRISFSGKEAELVLGLEKIQNFFRNQR